MFKNYFKTAWRSLIKNKIVAAINIAGLILGITACPVIYLDTNFELSYDNFHAGKESIYRVVTTMQKTSGEINKL